MSTPRLSHTTHTYLTLSLSPLSPFFSSPTSLPLPSSISYLGPVGSLPDVHLFGVPKEEWDDDLVRRLGEMQGVVRVEVQGPPRERRKRDEF